MATARIHTRWQAPKVFCPGEKAHIPTWIQNITSCMWKGPGKRLELIPGEEKTGLGKMRLNHDSVGSRCQQESMRSPEATKQIK